MNTSEDTTFPAGSLSLIMIVKNEAANIKKAVESARAFADEIIVNDTGSTDGTQDILDSMEVVWFQTDWQDDFSLARNQCLEKVHGTWAFWMDADDIVPTETSVIINRLKKHSPDCALGFEIVNIEGVSGLGARFMQIRMFPNHPALRFSGKIHENLSHALSTLNLKEIYQPAEIHHFGYQDETLKKEKARRNLKIINSEKERLASEPMFASSLGDAYYILEKWEKGIHAYLNVRNIPNSREKNADIYHEIPCLVGLGYMKMELWTQALEYLTRAEIEKPSKLEPKYYQARIYHATGDIHNAVNKYREITYMNKPVTGTINRYDSIHMNSFAKLAGLYLESGRLHDGEETARRMIDAYPDIVEGYYLLGQVLEQKGSPMEAVKAYLAGIKLNPSIYWPLHESLMLLLREMGAQEVFESSLRMAEKFFPRECEELVRRIRTSSLLPTDKKYHRY